MGTESSKWDIRASTQRGNLQKNEVIAKITHQTTTSNDKDHKEQLNDENAVVRDITKSYEIMYIHEKRTDTSMKIAEQGEIDMIGKKIIERAKSSDRDEEMQEAKPTPKTFKKKGNSNGSLKSSLGEIDTNKQLFDEEKKRKFNLKVRKTTFTWMRAG
ncbi:hypothetical protein ACH5RR_029671 [Cinchona calisaya]|uniref:Uncharacterized protein n=1 Tax=Cinchona calisaya TaxID=153742 RepID=A0ABD2YVW4_9GENT